MKRLRLLGRGLALLLLCAIALQLAFVLRIALMAVVDPQSTSFQRSELWRLATQTGRIGWSQQWRDGAAIAPALKRAVIASEDAGFVQHHGVDWDAVQKAWDRNQRAEQRAGRLQEQLQAQLARRRTSNARPTDPRVTPKVVGGSTITQQLAKNLFLSGERTLARKAQEFAITFALETLLSKDRILTIYLNNVEWGEGVFGAQAAARHYFRVDADRLLPLQAARLAVMLPAPKRFEKLPQSPYVNGRAATIAARMGDVTLP